MTDELTKARWRKNTNPADHPPERALEVALHDIRTGKVKPEHILICIRHVDSDDEMQAATQYYQAGTLDTFGQIGMLERIKHIMLNEG